MLANWYWAAKQMLLNERARKQNFTTFTDKKSCGSKPRKLLRAEH
jgi:hypothetical protein